MNNSTDICQTRNEKPSQQHTSNTLFDSGLPTTKIAIVGAGGFVGARFLRLVRQHPKAYGVGIVRSAKSLARLSNMEVRVADTSRASCLAGALVDCDTVVNAVSGDLSRVLEETETIYTAALAARCRLLVHLSSAVVFGRALSPNIEDDSPPDTRSWMLYARGKARSEVFLRQAMSAQPAMQVVVLRPGLVWGPGSHWSSMVGEQLSRGPVCLSNGGRGIANLVYVDNLVQMILAVHGSEGGPAGFYNVGDPQQVTWSHYYQSLARRLGYAETDIRTWPDAHLPLTPKLALEWCLQRQPLYRAARWLLPRVGLGFKAKAKKIMKGESLPPHGREGVPTAAPRLSREHWALQNTAFCLPTNKFFRDYGPLELTPLEDALDATASWLRFAGYAATGPFDLSHLW
jgi:nucleoside-diphosphate-sugar epimerase